MSSSSSGASHATGFASTPSSQSTGTHTAAPDSGNSGLSKGSKIGIGVGVAIVACLILGAAVFICLRRRQNRPQKLGVLSSAQEMAAAQNYGANELHDEARPGELNADAANARYELAGRRNIEGDVQPSVELPTQTTRPGSPQPQSNAPPPIPLSSKPRFGIR